MSNNEHAKAFTRLAEKMNDLAGKSVAMRDLFRSLGVGRYENVTVYRVGESKVRAHTRRGFVAVRINRKRE